MVIVDTTVWTDYLNGVVNAQTEWLDDSIHRESIALTELILCEVLQGIHDDARFRQVHRELARLEIFATAGEELAVASAKNYRLLRKRGLTVRKTIDCLIATFCIEEGHTLLHRDRDFDLFEAHLGLRVINSN